MKPRVAYSDLPVARWNDAFEKLKSLGEGATVQFRGEPLTVHWVHEDPNWVQLKGKKTKLMIRSGEPEIFELSESPR